MAKFDRETWTLYNRDKSGLPHNRVVAPAIDAQGKVWVGTRGGGLAKVDGENWTVNNTGNSGLPDDRVWSLAIDAQQSIWIGTNKGGLAVYRQGGVK